MNMYYVWREDNTVLSDIGSGTQLSFVPYGTRPAAPFSLQVAALKTMPQPGKPRAFAIAFGELPPNAEARGRQSRTVQTLVDGEVES